MLCLTAVRLTCFTEPTIYTDYYVREFMTNKTASEIACVTDSAHVVH